MPNLARLLAAALLIVSCTASTAGPASPAASTGSPTPGPTAITAITAEPSGDVAGATSSPGSATRTPAPTIETATAGGIVPGSVNRSSLNLRATYAVALNLNYGTRAIRTTTTIGVTNTSGNSIDRLELNTVAPKLGRMVLGAVTVDGTAAAATVSDQTIVVPLGGILPDGATTTVKVAYRATLRSTTGGSDWMFTRANGIVDLYRWIPWVSAKRAFTRPNHGDPFVTPVSPSVRVTVTSDRTLKIATSGRRSAVSGLVQTFVAENVRDFALTAATDYRTTSTTVGATTIRVYYRAGAPAATMLAAAKKALTRMNTLLGTYPYANFTVAQTAGGFGMEAPGMIWIPTGASNLSYLVTHETAHQWFYGLVGNDQANEPFADEAVTDFVTRYILSMRRSSRCSTARLDLSIYRYTSACYYEVIYIQGGNFLDDLRKRMGSTDFWRGLKGYVTANRYTLSTEKTLLDALDDATPLNLVPRYEPRFPRLY